MLLEEIFVGRQPIYDRKLDCYAYELLYRAGDTASAGVRDGTQATSQVVYNAFLELGLDKLVGERPAFLNLTRDFLLWDFTPLISPRRGVLEILENIRVDAELLGALRRLRAKGYRIALDD
jgi:EAL and modified HD-GYP domain-containing signal transduction protein